MSRDSWRWRGLEVALGAMLVLRHAAPASTSESGDLILRKVDLSSLSVTQKLAVALSPEELIKSILNVGPGGLDAANLQAAGRGDVNEDPCLRALVNMLVLAIRHSEDWALRMLDASGKVAGQSGLLNGNLHALGTFDECLPIAVNASFGGVLPAMPAFRGEYFLGSLKIISELVPPMPDNYTLPWLGVAMSRSYPHVERHDDFGVDWDALGNPPLYIQDLILGTLFKRPYLGLCLPSVCSVEQVEEGLYTALNDVFHTLFPEATFDFPYKYDIGEFHYHLEEREKFSAADIVAIVIILIFLQLVIVGTAIDIYGYRGEKAGRYKSIPVKILLSFSCFTNGKKLFNVSLNPASIDCLNGIRVISMSWVILGHTYFVGGLDIPWRNPFAIGNAMGDWYMLVIWNGLFSVDTFFLLSGFLLAYLMIQELDKTKGKVNIPLMYVHRYLRLTPLYGVVILMVSTLFLHLGSGPFWHFMEAEARNCEKNWWTNILYINNIVNTNEVCLETSWYLACDFQMMLIGPVLVWTIWRFQVLGLILGFIVLAVACAIPGVIAGVNDLPPVMTYTIFDFDYPKEIYIPFYTRISPYLWGILFAYIMLRMPKFHRRKPGMRRLPWLVVLIGWAVAITTGLACMFATFEDWKVNFSCVGNTDCFTVAEAVFYNSFARLSWAIAVAWVIFACQTGYAGIVGHFLCWPFFTPLSRITYAAYLLHEHLIFVFHYSRKSIMHFDKYLMCYFFIGHLIISGGLAIVFTLMFESPFIRLEKLAFGGATANKKSSAKSRQDLHSALEEQNGDAEGESDSNDSVHTTTTKEDTGTMYGQDQVAHIQEGSTQL